MLSQVGPWEWIGLFLASVNAPSIQWSGAKACGDSETLFQLRTHVSRYT